MMASAIRKVKGERKRLDLLWFTQKANKAPVFPEVILKEEQREKERKGKKERMTQGGQALVSKAHNFILKRNFYSLTCT